jgi:hypothetical protein
MSNTVTWACVADLNKVLGDYMSTVPRDVQIQRVTYGTITTDGCVNWSYGYTSTKYRNSKNAGAIVFANTEVFGKAFNYLLTGTDKMLLVPTLTDTWYCFNTWSSAYGCTGNEFIDLKYFKILLSWTWDGDTDIDLGVYTKPNY